MGRPSVQTDDPREPCLPSHPGVRKEIENRVEGELPGRHSGLGTQWLQPLDGEQIASLLPASCPLPGLLLSSSSEATKGSLWWGLHSQGRE